FAVSTYSGGLSNKEWIDRRPDFRSRLSWARLILIWLALARASIPWFRERWGAMEAFEDVVRVAVVMGGESTHQRPAIKTSPRIQVDLYLRSNHVEHGGRSRAPPGRGYHPLFRRVSCRFG